MHWIEATTGERFFSDYVSSLKDGVLLCKWVKGVGRVWAECAVWWGAGTRALPTPPPSPHFPTPFAAPRVARSRTDSAYEWCHVVFTGWPTS